MQVELQPLNIRSYVIITDRLLHPRPFGSATLRTTRPTNWFEYLHQTETLLYGELCEGLNN